MVSDPPSKLVCSPLLPLPTLQGHPFWPELLHQTSPTWVWLKLKQEGLRRFWSMFPLTSVPFWVPVFCAATLNDLNALQNKHGLGLGSPGARAHEARALRVWLLRGLRGSKLRKTKRPRVQAFTPEMGPKTDWNFLFATQMVFYSQTGPRLLASSLSLSPIDPQLHCQASLPCDHTSRTIQIGSSP